MDIELRNDRIPRNPFDRQFLDMCTDECTTREQELGLTYVPETVGDLQDKIEEQINIPACLDRS